MQNCYWCGRLIREESKLVTCPNCKEKDDEHFAVIKDIISKNSPISAMDLYEFYSIPLAETRHYLEQGSIGVVNNKLIRG